ncbi:MAG: hypothetical protein WAX69_19220 [Victivallales bacterium]
MSKLSSTLFSGVFIGASLLCQSAFGEAPAGRPQIPLSGEWKVQNVGKVEDGVSEKWEAKPFKLPGTRSLPKDKNGFWLERKIEIPADWKGARIVVHIGHPLFAAEVLVNGVRAGDIPAYGGELDISKHLQWDGGDTLRIFFPREGGTVLAGDDWASKVVAGLNEGQRAMVGVLGLPDTIYIERQPEEISVSDVWYRTFTRASARVEPQITLQAARPIKDVQARVAFYDGVKAEPCLKADFKLGDIPAGESCHTLIVPAKALKLWSLREPNLYMGQVTLLDSSGKELDRSTPTEFGVREFWIQGRDYYLNNQRINLTLDAYLFPKVEDALKAGVTLTFSKHAANGVNLIHDNEDEAFSCDRIGMGYISYGVGVGYDSPDLTNPAILSSYRNWVQAHLRKLRNHPSILFWVLSTNFGGGDVYNSNTIGRSAFMRWNHTLSAISYFEHRKADDTRPSFHHQAAGTGDMDTGNIYFNHLPIQSVEDWMESWKEHGDRPYMFIEFMGCPLPADYCRSIIKPPVVSYATEYAARLSGDKSYKEETAGYLDYSAHAVPRLPSHWDYDPLGVSPLLVEQLRKSISQTYLACRYYGVPTDLWVFPPNLKKFSSKDDPFLLADKELVQVATDVLRPDCFWIGGPVDEWTSKSHQFRPGDTIAKSVLCIHDQPYRSEATVKWEARLADGGTIIDSGTQKTALEPWSRTAVQFQFKAPENKSNSPLKLEITAAVSGVKGLPDIVLEPFACTIWPRLEPQAKAPGKIFDIIDPEGKSTACLEKSGAKLRQFDQEKTKPQTLIFGRRALREMNKLPFSAEDIYKGMRVVICEQNCGDLERMGFRTEDHCPRNVFVRSSSHPLMSGISDDALRDWNGNSTMLPWGPVGDSTRTPISRRTYHWSNRGTVASNIIETPHFGAFKAIADCEFDLAYSPLVSWRHGAGEIVFMQMDVSGRTESDPAAELICRNIVRYLDTPLEGMQNRTAICASQKTSDRISSLGFSSAPWSGSLDPARNILVFGKGDSELWPKLRESVLAFVDKGGTVLFLPVADEIIADPVFKGLSLKTLRTSRAGTSVDSDKLFDGVGLQHLHWREPIDLFKLEADASSKFQSLLGGLAGTLPYGKGRFVFLQVDPDVFGDYAAAKDDDSRLRKVSDKPLPDAWYAKDRNRSRWQSNRLDALLLTNLGLESSPSLARSLFEGKRKMPFYPVEKWMMLGPIPPPENPDADPIAVDFSSLLKVRTFEKPVVLPSGKSIPWYAPNDFNNGLGIGGMIDLSKAYGVKTGQTSIAMTYLWSSRDRMSTLQFGADWWLKIDLNGKEIFRTGSDVQSHSGQKFSKDFAFTVKAPLKKGWNEVICTVGSGSGGNAFWFQVSNPGDMMEEQSIIAPKDEPAIFLRFAAGGQYGKMTKEEMLESENAPAGFPLYTDPLTVTDDPYLYMRW